jgi:hypothetical protein
MRLLRNGSPRWLERPQSLDCFPIPRISKVQVSNGLNGSVGLDLNVVSSRTQLAWSRKIRREHVGTPDEDESTKFLFDSKGSESDLIEN